jgi:Xaa-Pro aminopeptidase
MNNEFLMSLHGRLSALRVDALIFNTSEVTPSVNLRFLAGFTGSDATIVITRTERRLFTDGRYKTQAAQEAPAFNVVIKRNKLDSIAAFIRKMGVRRIGLESQRVSYAFIEALKKRTPNVEFKSLTRNFLEGIRLVKRPFERDKIKRAAVIASRACKQVIESGLEGRSESDVAMDLETGFRTGGAQDIAFGTIVASGKRSALPHGIASSKTINKGDLVLMDYGCRLDGYHSDESVTCVVGKPTKGQKKMHTAVYDAHMRAMEAAKPGISPSDLDAIARRTIDKAGYGGLFMHGLGHGVGLEIHEPPSVSPRGRGKLQEGMVFTIEPGIYVEGFGGVRLESLVYLDSSGPEYLSEMSKDLIIID